MSREGTYDITVDEYRSLPDILQHIEDWLQERGVNVRFKYVEMYRDQHVSQNYHSCPPECPYRQRTDYAHLRFSIFKDGKEQS